MVSRSGGLRQRSVFGPAAMEKKSMHCGRVKDWGRLTGVKQPLSGGILNISASVCEESVLRFDESLRF